MIRTQFPLRLACTLGVNKTQGQEFKSQGREFNKALYDLIDPSFSHRHTMTYYDLYDDLLRPIL